MTHRRTLTFLNPVEILPGRARILRPDFEIESVPAIPDWYWTDEVRLLHLATLGLQHDVWVAAYFTCYAEDDGCMFKVVVCTEVDRTWYQEVGRTVTRSDATAMFLDVCAAWWDGHSSPPLPGRPTLPGFVVPPCPNDDDFVFDHPSEHDSDGLDET